MFVINILVTLKIRGKIPIIDPKTLDAIVLLFKDEIITLEDKDKFKINQWFLIIV